MGDKSPAIRLNPLHTQMSTVGLCIVVSWDDLFHPECLSRNA